MNYSKDKIKKSKLNKRIKVVFEKFKKYFKIVFLLINFKIISKIYIETNTLFIIIKDIYNNANKVIIR